jgi:hypothetical protein
MGINVQAPNGSVVTFPDGTDTATINAVMSQHFGGPVVQKTARFGGAPSNVFDQFDRPGKPFDPDAYLAKTGASQPPPGLLFDDLPKAEAPSLVGGTAQSFIEGVPILGPALRNANAALSAAVAPYIPSESSGSTSRRS